MRFSLILYGDKRREIERIEIVGIDLPRAVFSTFNHFRQFVRLALLILSPLRFNMNLTVSVGNCILKMPGVSFCESVFMGVWFLLL